MLESLELDITYLPIKDLRPDPAKCLCSSFS